MSNYVFSEEDGEETTEIKLKSGFNLMLCKVILGAYIWVNINSYPGRDTDMTAYGCNLAFQSIEKKLFGKSD